MTPFLFSGVWDREESYEVLLNSILSNLQIPYLYDHM